MMPLNNITICASMRLFGNITFFTPLEHINGLLLLFIFPQFDYPHHIFYICSSQYPTSP